MLETTNSHSSVLYVGVDESNHGRFPEYFAAIFSKFKQDTLRGEFVKKESINRLFERLKKRDSTFLLLEESHYEGKNPKRNAGKFTLIDKVVGSLMKGTDMTEYERIKILIDGEFTVSKQNYIRDSVSDTCNLDSSRLTIHCGPQFDEKYLLVNMADELAHYLFRNPNLEKLPKNSLKRYLII